MAKASSSVPAAPLEDCICSRSPNWPLYVQGDTSSRCPYAIGPEPTRALIQDHGAPRTVEAINLDKYTFDCAHQGFMHPCVNRGEEVCVHAYRKSAFSNLWVSV